MRVEGRGEPLVLLHGLGRSLADWSLLQPMLADTYTTIALDLPGFGATAREAGPLDLAALARGVRHIVRGGGETRTLRLVGNSLGGAVAMRMAADRPAETAGVVLISPVGIGRRLNRTAAVLAAPVVGETVVATRSALARRAPRVLNPGRQAPDGVLAGLRDAAARRGNARNYLDVLRVIARDGAGLDGALDGLTATGVPVTVLWGDRDAVLPFRHLAAVPERLPHAQTRVLAGLGHVPHLQRPEVVAEAIRAAFS